MLIPTAKDLWNRVQLFRERKRRKGFSASFRTITFEAKLKCHRKWGEVSSQSGSVMGKEEEVKARRKIVEIWRKVKCGCEREGQRWKKYCSTDCTIGRPECSPTGNSLSLHPQYCLSAGHEPEILLPRGDLFCQPHIFVSLSVVGKLQEQNIFHKFTFWSTLRILTAQCQFGLYYIKLDLPLIF